MGHPRHFAMGLFFHFQFHIEKLTTSTDEPCFNNDDGTVLFAIPQDNELLIGDKPVYNFNTEYSSIRNKLYLQAEWLPLL